MNRRRPVEHAVEPPGTIHGLPQPFAAQAPLIEQAAAGDTAAIAEAAAIEKTAVALQAQIDKQTEANRLKEEAASAARAAYETQVALTEAIALQNPVEAARLKYAQDYAAALKSANGDTGLATRMADAQAKIRDDAQAERDASEAQKQKAAQAAQAEREALAAAKKEELEREVAIAEAKALGNKEEAAKLEWIRQYNALQARGFSEDQARRIANADAMQTPGISPASAPYVPPGTQGGDLFSGTNRRKGVSSSDAFNESALNLPPGGSLLDQYKANQSRPVGSINGQSILPADPTSSAKGGQQDSGAGEVKSAATAVNDSTKELATAASELAAAGKNLNGEGIQKLVSQVKALAEQVKALAAKV
jgi:hypothetical protein